MKTYEIESGIETINSSSAGTERIERLKENPRSDFIEAIRTGDTARCLLKTAEIHGHFCPGSALGVMAAMYGLELICGGDIFSEGLEDLMAVVEINACFADGVQAVSGCTLGNNALVYRDFGKHAVTFAIRGVDTAIRVCARPDFRSCIHRLVPEFYPLMEKVIKNRAGTEADEKQFKEKGREAAFALIQLDFEQLLSTNWIRSDLPGYAPIVGSVICPVCGEQLMSTKAARNGECLACSSGEYFQVEGQGIVRRKA
jgi:formylmethanofuran dehydrogenase subunit E